MQAFDLKKIDAYFSCLCLLEFLPFVVGPLESLRAYFPSGCVECACVCMRVARFEDPKLKTTTHYFNLIDSARIKSKTQNSRRSSSRAQKKKKCRGRVKRAIHGTKKIYALTQWLKWGHSKLWAAATAASADDDVAIEVEVLKCSQKAAQAEWLRKMHGMKTNKKKISAAVEAKKDFNPRCCCRWLLLLLWPSLQRRLPHSHQLRASASALSVA